MSTFKPMLAARMDETTVLRFPMMLSPKLDGIRATVRNGTLVSRNLKPIPNHHIRNALSRPQFEGLDGELIVGPAFGPGVFNRTTSAVMSQQGVPMFDYHVFDSNKHPELPWEERIASHPWAEYPTTVKFLSQHLVKNMDDIAEWEEAYLREGYEGVMLRDPYAPYKYGRSTLKEQKLLKLKRFEDSEATVIGVEELYSNNNEATINELGYVERTSHQANLIPQGVLGALVVEDIANGWRFKIGTGFTAGHRQELWHQRSHLPGLVVKYRYQPIGMKDVPRFPVFLGFRAEEDMSE